MGWSYPEHCHCFLEWQSVLHYNLNLIKWHISYMMSGYSCRGKNFLLLHGFHPLPKKTPPNNGCILCDKNQWDLEVTPALSLRKVPPDAFSEFLVPQNAVKSSLGYWLEKQENVLTTVILETLSVYSKIHRSSELFSVSSTNEKKITNHQTQNFAAFILNSEKSSPFYAASNVILNVISSASSLFFEA